MKWSRDRDGDSGRVGWFREGHGRPMALQAQTSASRFIRRSRFVHRLEKRGISLEEGWQEQWGREGNS